MKRLGDADVAVKQRLQRRLWQYPDAAISSTESREARLVTPEGYALTALTAVEALVRVLAGKVAAGFMTPSKAFGPDFILEVPGVERHDVPASGALPIQR